MNIFALSFDQGECARRYCDIHVRKMLLETAQILSTALRCAAGIETPIEMPNGKVRKVRLLAGEEYKIIDGKLELGCSLYVQTHINHPCCVWARQSMSNFHWLWGLGMKLDEEYYTRFGKRHKSRQVLNWIGNTEFPISLYITSNHASSPYKIDPWPMCLDEDIRQRYNERSVPQVIKAYREYYNRKLENFKERGLL